MPGNKSARDVRVGKNIRAARKRAGIGQAELARAINVTAPSMWRYESGHHCPIDKLELIARVCDTSVAVLLEGASSDDAPRRTRSATQDEYLKIANLAIEAAQQGTQEARDRLEAVILEHAERLSPKR